MLMYTKKSVNVPLKIIQDVETRGITINIFVELKESLCSTISLQDAFLPAILGEKWIVLK